MIAATITLSTAGAAALGLALIALGMLVQLRLTMWAEADDELITQDEAITVANSGAVPRIPEQRTSPEGGAR